MPDAPVSPDQPLRRSALFDDLGLSGLQRYSGYIYEEPLPELQLARGRRVFREMAENDATIGGILLAIELLVRQVTWSVSPASSSAAHQQDAQFVDECLGDSSLTWQDTMAETFTFLPFGWSYLETVYKYRGGVSDDPKRNSKYKDGKIGWRKWSPRAQETLLRWEFDPDGGVKGLWQLAPPDFVIRYIPIEKALLFRTTSRKGNPEGRSILRNAFTSWYAKTNIQRIEAIGVERDLAGLPTVWVPPELLSSGATADEKAQLAAFKAMVVNIRRDEQEGVIMPLAYHPTADGSPSAQKMYDFTLTSSGGARQFDTDAIIARYDQRIATSILADFILLGQEQMGSFALSEDKTQLFLTALATWLDSVSAVVNRFAIPRLLRLNGRDLSDGSPELKHGKIERPDIAKLGPYVQALAAAGVNVAGMADGKYLLDAASIPATDALSGPDQPDVQAAGQEPGQQTGERGGGGEQEETQA